MDFIGEKHCNGASEVNKPNLKNYGGKGKGEGEMQNYGMIKFTIIFIHKLVYICADL